MLVITRQRDCSVIIGEGPDAVRVKVVDIRGDKVRLAFDAPQSVKIDREEVRLEQILAGQLKPTPRLDAAPSLPRPKPTTQGQPRQRDASSRPSLRSPRVRTSPG